jgi:hypothetical protein
VTSFSPCVVIETKVAGRLRAVGSVREAAEILISSWPTSGRGNCYLAALQACHDALGGKLDTEAARQAFIAAAKEVDVFVREAPVRGG